MRTETRVKPDCYTNGFVTPCQCEQDGIESGSDIDCMDDPDMYIDYARLLGVFPVEVDVL